MEAVIPPLSNRKQLRDYDRHLYKLRHLVGNAFLRIKEWRGIATRYAKSHPIWKPCSYDEEAEIRQGENQQKI